MSAFVFGDIIHKNNISYKIYMGKFYKNALQILRKVV